MVGGAVVCSGDVKSRSYLVTGCMLIKHGVKEKYISRMPSEMEILNCKMQFEISIYYLLP